MRHPIALSVLAGVTLLAVACGAPSSNDSTTSTSEALKPILPKVPVCTVPFTADFCERVSGEEMCGCEGKAGPWCTQTTDVSDGSLPVPAGMAGCTIGERIVSVGPTSRSVPIQADFWLCPTDTALLQGYYWAPWQPICAYLGAPYDGWSYVVANVKPDGDEVDGGHRHPGSGCDGACSLIPDAAYPQEAHE
jgi:hypothetical protein